MKQKIFFWIFAMFIIVGAVNGASPYDCTNETLVKFNDVSINNTGTGVSQVTVRAEIDFFGQNYSQNSLRVTKGNDLTSYYPHYVEKFNTMSNATIYFFVNETWNANEVKNFSVCGGTNTTIPDTSNQTQAFWYFRDFNNLVHDLTGTCTVSVVNDSNCNGNPCMRESSPNGGRGNACYNLNWFSSYPSYSKGSFNMTIPMIYEMETKAGTLASNGIWFGMWINSTAGVNSMFAFKSQAYSNVGTFLDNVTTDFAYLINSSTIDTTVWINHTFRSYGNGTFRWLKNGNSIGTASMPINPDEITGFAVSSYYLSSPVQSWWDNIRGYKTFSNDAPIIQQTFFNATAPTTKYNFSKYSPTPTYSNDVVKFNITITDPNGLYWYLFSFFNVTSGAWQNYTAVDLPQTSYIGTGADATLDQWNFDSNLNSLFGGVMQDEGTVSYNTTNGLFASATTLRVARQQDVNNYAYINFSDNQMGYNLSSIKNEGTIYFFAEVISKGSNVNTLVSVRGSSLSTTVDNYGIFGEDAFYDRPLWFGDDSDCKIYPPNGDGWNNPTVGNRYMFAITWKAGDRIIAYKNGGIDFGASGSYNYSCGASGIDRYSNVTGNILLDGCPSFGCDAGNHFSYYAELFTIVNRSLTPEEIGDIFNGNVGEQITQTLALTNVTAMTNATMPDIDYFNWTWYANNSVGQTSQSEYFYLNITDVSPPVINQISINDSTVYHNDVILISANVTNNRMLDKCWLYDSWNGINHSFNQLDNVSDTCNIAYSVTAPKLTTIDFVFYVNDSHGLTTNYSFVRNVLNAIPTGKPILNVSSGTFSNGFTVNVSNVTDYVDNDTLTYLWYYQFNTIPPVNLLQNSTLTEFNVSFVAQGNYYLKVVAFDGNDYGQESDIYAYAYSVASGGGSNLSFFINQSAKLEFNSCPETSSSLILLIFLFVVGIGLFVIGKKYKANVLGVIGGIIIIIFGVLIFNCQELIGIIMIAVGVIIAMISAFIGKLI